TGAAAAGGRVVGRPPPLPGEGGHGAPKDRGRRPVWLEPGWLALVPRVVGAVTPRPVVVPGGLAGARGVVAAMRLGAHSAMSSSRFLVGAESRTHLRNSLGNAGPSCVTSDWVAKLGPGRTDDGPCASGEPVFNAARRRGITGAASFSANAGLGARGGA